MAQLRQHEFICRYHEELGATIIEAPLGEAPEVPDCPVCELPMAKVFGATVSYARKWRISMGR